jgi:ribonuclease HI
MILFKSHYDTLAIDLVALKPSAETRYPITLIFFIFFYEEPAVKTVILGDNTAAKREAIRWAKEREAKVGAGVWMWWTDGSRSDDGKVRAAAVCKHGDGWKAFRSHLGTGRVEVYDAELWAIGLALRESVRKRDRLRTHGVTKVGVFSDSQAAIRRTEHLEPGPGQPLARWINQSARTLREAGIETEIHCVPGHTGIPGNEEPDRQANLPREGRRTGTVRERVYTSAANRTRRISEAKTAAKAEWEADKCSKHHGYRLKGKTGNKRPILMNSVKPLAARFYRLKSGNAPVGTYLKRFGHRDDDKCWWCGGGGRTVAQTQEHLFRHCRCRHVQVSELLSMEKCDKAVMDFLAATDVGKLLPKTGGGVRAGGFSLISSLFLCILSITLVAFFCKQGTTGSRSRAPPSSRPARRRRGFRGCHTLSRVNTV